VYVSQTLLSSSCTSLAFDVRLHFSLVSADRSGAPESSWARRHEGCYAALTRLCAATSTIAPRVIAGRIRPVRRIRPPRLHRRSP